MRWFILFGLMGCGVSKETFPKSAANAYCPQIKKCELGMFESVYNDEMSTCKEQVEADVDTLMVVLNTLTCEFDEKAAHDCLAKVSQMSCAEYHDSIIDDACADIYGACEWF
jgi:hypothetical protein